MLTSSHDFSATGLVAANVHRRRSSPGLPHAPNVLAGAQTMSDIDIVLAPREGCVLAGGSLG